MYVTAEMEPLIATGGLGAASAGLVGALRADGVDVVAVLPDYSGWTLDDEEVHELAVPAWVGSATVRVGLHDGAGRVALVSVPGIARPHPYVDPSTGHGWPDNDHRFFAWSCAVAAWARRERPGVVHVNDWHAATVLAHLDPDQATVLSIHNLAHQGWADAGWLPLLGLDPTRFAWQGSTNALAGAIRSADRLVTVSPRYADEIRSDWNGMGLTPLLVERGPALVGILNGIDTDEWNPATDRHLEARYSEFDSAAKAANAAELCGELGLLGGSGPLVVCVSRFDHQKAIECLIEASRVTASVPVRVAILGSGDPAVEQLAGDAAVNSGGRIAFRSGYNQKLAHLMFGAGDLTVIPSRFEPCGLTQMQAMRYGTIPIVSDVGGLHDTVIDADRSPRSGTGVVLGEVSAAGVVDGLHRGARLWANRSRRARVAGRGMSRDWSWATSAATYRDLYRDLGAAKR